MAANGRSTLGRSYRSYRFPQRKGGRLSRRPGGGSRLGSLAGGLTAFLLAMLLMGGVAAAAVIGYFTADLPTAHDLVTVPVSLTTRIYDRSGEHLLYTLEDERRELIGLDSVPKMMQDATIAIEDKSFWTNPGIDIGGIIRALNANAASGTISQGGSTITQQLIKTRLLSDEPTFTRKIKEAILALEATRTFSKAQILEMYLNDVYLGQRGSFAIHGVAEASRLYFAKDVSNVTLAEAATIAGLLQILSLDRARARDYPHELLAVIRPGHGDVAIARDDQRRHLDSAEQRCQIHVANRGAAVGIADRIGCEERALCPGDFGTHGGEHRPARVASDGQDHDPDRQDHRDGRIHDRRTAAALVVVAGLGEVREESGQQQAQREREAEPGPGQQICRTETEPARDPDRTDEVPDPV